MAQQNARPLPQPRFNVLVTGFQQIATGFTAVAPELAKLPNINPVLQHQEVMAQFERLHARFDTDVGQLRTEVGHLRTEVGQLRTEITNTNRRIDALDAKVDNLDFRFEASARNSLAMTRNAKLPRGQSMTVLERLVNVKTAMAIPDFPDYSGDIASMPRAKLVSVLRALGYQVSPNQTDDDLKRDLERRVGLLWD